MPENEVPDEYLREFEKASLVEAPAKTGAQYLQKIEKSNGLLLEETRLISSWLYQKNPNTRDAYERDLKAFFSFFHGHSLKKITTAHIAVYLKEISEGREVSTIARTKSSISSLFKYLVKVRYLDVNPADHLDAIKVPDQTQYRVLDHEEIRRMIDLEPEFRNQVIIRLLYKTGLRVSELCGLKFSSLRKRDSNFFIIVLGKGNKTRTVQIDQKLYDDLTSLQDEEWRIHSPSSSSLTRHAVLKIIKEAARRASVSEKASPHWMRHSHATKALELGGGFAGHSIDPRA